MTVSFDRSTGTAKIKKLDVENVEGIYYSDELTALKEKILPLADAVQETRAAYLTAIYNVDQANAADVIALEGKEAELAELTESKAGVSDAKELMAINKAEKELKEEIEAQKEINVTLVNNRKVMYEDAADAAFTALEAYKPVLQELNVEYGETKSSRTEHVYYNELSQFRDVYNKNAKSTFVSLCKRVQPVWFNDGRHGTRFGILPWRGHSMQVYDRM